jgi:DNA-binding transcriptional LysR family regulator
MNLNHLAIFHAVAEARSVSRGAERLGISQAAVSKQLKTFERSFGVPLFDRTARGVAPTAAGELLAGYARRLFALAGEAEQAMAELNGLSRGTLAVGASTTIGVYLLPDVFVKLRQAHPGVATRMEIAGSQVLLARLAVGAIDLAITDGQIDGDAFEKRVLLHDELVPIAPMSHPLARKRAVSLKDFCREPFVVRETGSGTQSLVEQAVAQRGLELRAAMTLGSTEAIKRAVIAGVGVAVVSRLAVAADLAAGKLAEVRVSGLKLRRPVYLVRSRDRWESRAVAAFSKLLHEMLSLTHF